jgi:hypothetical protein
MSDESTSEFSGGVRESFNHCCNCTGGKTATMTMTKNKNDPMTIFLLGHLRKPAAI